MKKRILAIILCFCMIFALPFTIGCNNNVVSVVSVEKTASQGLTDIYTITYSDGSTFTFEVKNGVNGVDGENGNDLTIEQVFEKYLEIHPGATYEEFLEKFLSSSADGNAVATNKALLSSAKIYTEFTVEQAINPFQYVIDTAISSGSAVIYKIDSDYTYFITNYHVVYNKSAHETDKLAKNINIYLYGSEDSPVYENEVDINGYAVYEYGDYAIKAEYVGGSIVHDLAIVRAQTSVVKDINSGVQPITFASSYKVGETAIAIGNAEDEGLSVTEGIISVDNEFISLDIDGASRTYRSIRIDTPIYSGNSGGGLYDTEGNLIGITNAGDGTDQNVNYAIPLKVVRGVVENLMEYSKVGSKKVNILSLGINVLAVNSKYVYDSVKGYGEIQEEVVVSAVQENSIAKTLGLEENYKLLAININGTPYKLTRYFDIGDIILTIRSGDAISVTFNDRTSVKTGAEYVVQATDIKEI